MPRNNRMLIIKCGDTFPDIRSRHGDFDAWFEQPVVSLGGVAEVWNAHNERQQEAKTGYCGILVTGSPAMVTDRAGWSESLGAWLAARVREGVPVLGVCYGHQLLAHALGGEVDYQPGGREIGSLLVELHSGACQDDWLFSGLPASFYAHLTHSQSVLGLPDGAVNLARSARVSHQAIRFAPKAWGVQFHPEFSESIMSEYLSAFGKDLPAEVINHLGPHPAPVPEQLLTRFIRGCLEGSICE